MIQLYNNNNNNNNNNNIYLLGANSTVQFSNATYNKINYILDHYNILKLILHSKLKTPV